MPNVHVTLPETEQSIFRPIVIEIVEQVQKITDMKDTVISFPDENKKAITSGGSIDSKNDKYVETSSKRKNQIEVEEEIDREEMSPTFFNDREYTPIFQDRKLGLTISPVYAKHNVTVTFNYYCGSKTEAMRWLQDMRMKLSRLRDINVHSVQYHYNLHKELYDILKMIHELREKQGGYDQSFENYISNHANPRLTVVGDLTGKKNLFAVAERQTEIYGIFDFDALPSRPEKDQETGMWIIAFGYKFNYDKPIGCHMRYPVIVHNQPMPLEFVSFTSEEVRAIAQAPTDCSRSQSAFRMFRADCVMDAIKDEDGVITIPRFDDFKPDSTLRSTAGVLQALCSISPTNKKELLNLKDLGDIVLDDDLLEFIIESEYQHITKPYRSILHIDLYQNTSLQDYKRLFVDYNLNVISSIDLDIRNEYRIRLSIVTDINLLDNAAIQRLRQYPKALYKIVAAINRALRENPEANGLGRINSPLTVEEFNAIYRTLLGLESGGFNIGNIGWGIQNSLKNMGINPSVLNRINHESKLQKRTMILGVLAFKKEDNDIHNVTASNLDLPLMA